MPQEKTEIPTQQEAYIQLDEYYQERVFEDLIFCPTEEYNKLDFRVAQKCINTNLRKAIWIP